MRVLIPFTVLFLSGCSHLANDHWSGQDKAQHFMASAMLSAAGNEYARHQGVSPDRSAAIGLMFSLSLGASKELWDSRPEGSRKAAAGAGKILSGMSLARQPVTLSGKWRDTKGASPFLYGATSAKPGKPERPSR